MNLVQVIQSTDNWVSLTKVFNFSEASVSAITTVKMQIDIILILITKQNKSIFI